LPRPNRIIAMQTQTTLSRSPAVRSWTWLMSLVAAAAAGLQSAGA
jgi:hypothetical protein